ncbi:conserved hypothetical protein [Ricinus communis]|uniref:Uncharacterized protein n=1 Tax=Ricinus communis TaxID=3988 RepID=B9SIE3_RICCO|nr:conserved hypothetical protein [Ricinus communis]
MQQTLGVVSSEGSSREEENDVENHVSGDVNENEGIVSREGSSSEEEENVPIDAEYGDIEVDGDAGSEIDNTLRESREAIRE